MPIFAHLTIDRRPPLLVNLPPTHTCALLAPVLLLVITPFTPPFLTSNDSVTLVNCNVQQHLAQKERSFRRHRRCCNNERFKIVCAPSGASTPPNGARAQNRRTAVPHQPACPCFIKTAPHIDPKTYKLPWAQRAHSCCVPCGHSRRERCCGLAETDQTRATDLRDSTNMVH